jgi:PAS domain S-box-containing protein
MNPSKDYISLAGTQVGIGLDITQSQQADERIRESEQRFREMLDALPVAIYTTDAEGRLTHFNPAAIEFSGRVPKLGTDQWCVSWKLYHPDGMPMPHDKCPMAIALKEGRTVRGAEAIAERPDGKRIWFMPYPTPLRDSAGRVVGGINMLLDITEHKRAEEAKAHLAAIVESSDDAIISKSLQGIIKSWNKGAENLFGYTAAEAVGKSITMLIPPQRLDEEPKILESIKRGERVDHYETVRRHKDGTDIDISLTVSAVRDEAGNIIGASKVARGISERKRAEWELSELVRQQGALYQLVDQLHHTNSLEDAFNAALEAILSALQCDRASILLFDDTGVMRFVSWRGLSDVYRKATEGHSPWKPDEKNPQPITLNEIGRAELSDSLKATINAEGIGSLAFIPLVSNGKLIGKFMVYFNAPHVFDQGELELSLTIAHQLAFGIDRKRAEESLHTSEALYRTIARSIPGGGVYVVDKDFRYIVAEGSVTEAFGLAQEMLEGHTVSEVFTPEQSARMEERLKKNFAGETVDFETKYNGRVFWTQQAPLIDSIGRAIVVTIDITERKQAEEALRDSEKRYHDLFDLVPIAVYTCDADGLIQDFNQHAVELWGRKPKKNSLKEKFCGSFKRFYLDGRFMPHDECPMARVLRGETLKPHELEIIVERRDGRRKNVIAHPRPLKNEHGEIVGAINCVYDITPRIQAEEALHESKKQLQALNETLEQKVKEQTSEVRKLASDLTKAEQRERHRIAHILHDDLQQRLYAIQMEVTLLRERLELEDVSIQRDFAAIKEQLDEVVAVTRNLSVDLSPPILRDEGLAQAISWLASQMQEQYGLHIELQADGSFALPDEELQVLLYNSVRELLFNIVKHAGVNQAVVALQRSNDDLLIEVRDGGKGFDAAALARHISNKVEDSDEQHPGFGLPTLRHQLSLFGGRMEIQSAPGAGTRTSVTIPVYNGRH